MAPIDASVSATPITAWWGKLGSGKDTTGYHPLICHMLDVAAVTEAMWDEVLSGAARHAITTGLGMEDEAAARVWVAFLAGAHDTGKCSPSFALRSSAAALAPLYRDCKPNPKHGNPSDAPHGQVTACELPAILRQRFALPRKLAQTLATAVGGHHGIFPTDDQLNRLEDKPDAVGEGDWREGRERLVIRLGALLGVEGLATSQRAGHAVALSLAGLVSVADWIGSMEECFPYLVTDLSNIPAVDVDYLARTRDQARQALDELHWTGWTPDTRRPSFPQMFDGRQPRPLQEAAIALAERLQGPGLVVIEAPMGEGKTEAALYLADRWGSQRRPSDSEALPDEPRERAADGGHAGAELGARGLYLALPTQATSNQMFGRLQRFLEHRYPVSIVNLQLLHGRADLRADFEELKRRGELIPHLTPEDEGEEQAGVIAAGWFAQRKRGLLAPFGVGTVDQALLAVLRTKHVFVRLYGLANRVVVIDEVHAYDTYMTALIERLLEWLAALGSPVILLSATLPRSRRDTLLGAYARGLAGRDATPPEAPEVSYPRMSWVLARRDRSIESDAIEMVPAQPPRALRLRWEDGQIPHDPAAPFPLGEELQKALENGGCAAIICNTVRRAQRVYKALERYFPGTASDGLPVLDLFHARYLFKDRDEREKRTLLRFGAEGATVDFGNGGARTVQRPDRAVLVATQVIEQSLDLDFDLMVTDFAPVDLMLQRAGRLWRHARERPAGLDGPVLWICEPERDELGIPLFPGGDALIYDEHVLFRSWLTTRGRKTAMLPDDIEPLVEAAYGDTPPSENLNEAELVQWRETLEAMEQGRAADTDEAKKRWILRPDADNELWKFTESARAEDEPSFHPEHQALTRLAEPSVQVVFLYGDPLRPSLEYGGRGINLKPKPSSELTRELLSRSVTLQSPKGLVHYLMQRRETPPGWRVSPHLRNARLIVLDANGEAEQGAYHIRLDPNLGVVAEKASTPENEQG